MLKTFSPFLIMMRNVRDLFSSQIMNLSVAEMKAAQFWQAIVINTGER